jgi:D-glycero-alpha-D-manno-heptose 1-phosphate guanylyltransferase
MAVTEAIILAGGLGTRLRTAVPHLPKCMAPINGKPFIRFVIRYLQQQGITRIIFSLGYRSDAFTDFLTQTLATDQYSIVVEKEPLGTGGAIRFAMQSAVTDDIVVVNGDSIFSPDLRKQYELHMQQQAECTLALKPMQHFDRYGVVETDESGRILAFHEKKAYENGLINGGVYIINKTSFLSNPFPEKFSFETDYLQRFYKEKILMGFVQDAYFIDIGIPEDYQRAQKELKD